MRGLQSTLCPTPQAQTQLCLSPRQMSLRRWSGDRTLWGTETEKAGQGCGSQAAQLHLCCQEGTRGLCRRLLAGSSRSACWAPASVRKHPTWIQDVRGRLSVPHPGPPPPVLGTAVGKFWSLRTGRDVEPGASARCRLSTGPGHLRPPPSPYSQPQRPPPWAQEGR